MCIALHSARSADVKYVILDIFDVYFLFLLFPILIYCHKFGNSVKMSPRKHIHFQEWMRILKYSSTTKWLFTFQQSKNYLNVFERRIHRRRITDFHFILCEVDTLVQVVKLPWLSIITSVVCIDRRSRMFAVESDFEIVYHFVCMCMIMTKYELDMIFVLI